MTEESGYVERPDYRVDVLRRRNLVTVRAGDTVIARSESPLVVDEQDHGVVFYLPEADVVVLVTPLTEETRHLAGADFLSRMRDGALLVNVARGPVVDTKALLAELESGRISAALDVTDPEPLPAGHPLWHAPNTLISPHVGGSSSAFLPRAKRLLASQLTRYVSGAPLEHIVATA